LLGVADNSVAAKQKVMNAYRRMLDVDFPLRGRQTVATEIASLHIKIVLAPIVVNPPHDLSHLALEAFDRNGA
jgi:hypothetical protein